ncbi:hypothetical protein DES53_101954 [Roseimicrobium gellanilyticum]|uniref:Lipoprotein n=1 Tax=Roseimicrobium gellanilyticum TaxID=748857 RepID=A0A366HX66_9BACT|nr:hypothetical protein [Roseimicrobium gellanilyticum]RBP48154.1 hypothetical protein DES53_101954 [Roseimicrobium gellanilyticum]
MTPRTFLTLTACLLLASCGTSKTNRTSIITDVIPAGSRIEYYGQIHGDTWLPTMVQTSIPSPMPVKEAQQWALSAAQQRLGDKWKDYLFRVTAPGEKPIILWQRRNHVQL